MASPLIATKLFVPKPRVGAVQRLRLSERLEQGANSKLTLISAPAGFGKTAILAAWLAARPADHRAVAWLSLDQADNEAVSFWTRVIETLEKAAAAKNKPLLQVPRPEGQPLDLILASIVNEVASYHGIMDLILDDYHVIDQREVQAGMAFLLDHLPPNIHVVIATRADPALPLARLRSRGELVEIRSADLRFTGEEIGTYLNESMGLGLTRNEMNALEDRTEGWIAALQLAALSMQGRTDITSFISGFAGDDRYVFEYLLEEVLERQSIAVRSFLLQTCFLDRLSGPLCDAVTNKSGSKGMLDALYRANLFLVPLDDRREWYRYHHLFADVLLAQLGEDARHELPTLHRRASDWHDKQGERSDAIRHALAGECFARAAELIELAIPETQRNRGEATIRGWLRALPDHLVRARPVLGIGFVAALAASGEFEEVEDRLRVVEEGLAAIGDIDPASPELLPLGVMVADKRALPHVPAAIELYRAVLAQVRGDMPGLINHARRVLHLAQPDDLLNRAAASALLGIAYWSGGDLDLASRSWTECRGGLQRTGNLSDMLGVSVALADIHFVQGHLGEAERVYDEMLRLAAAQGSVLRGSADMHAGLSEIHRERNDPQAAHQDLIRSEELGERAGLPQHPYRRRVAAAKLREDAGDLEGAVTLLDEAVRLYVSDFFPNVRPVAAIRARVWIAQGRLEAALGWHRESGLGVDDELSYLREFEHITLARLLLSRDASDTAAFDLVDRLLDAADRGGRHGRVIELSILKAIAARHRDVDEALLAVERALALAAPEGHARLFIDEGPPMMELLKLAVKRRIVPDYARKLLAGFGKVAESPHLHRDLIEPLSERELDVLRLLRSDLSGPDIARELMVSVSTIRTHTKNIYEKLGVNTRRLAVRRADELNVFRRSEAN